MVASISWVYVFKYNFVVTDSPKFINISTISNIY
jgi:hypothetical protein